MNKSGELLAIPVHSMYCAVCLCCSKRLDPETELAPAPAAQKSARAFYCGMALPPRLPLSPHGAL